MWNDSIFFIGIHYIFDWLHYIWSLLLSILAIQLWLSGPEGISEGAARLGCVWDYTGFLRRDCILSVNALCLNVSSLMDKNSTWYNAWNFISMLSILCEGVVNRIIQVRNSTLSDHCYLCWFWTLDWTLQKWSFFLVFHSWILVFRMLMKNQLLHEQI